MPFNIPTSTHILTQPDRATFLPLKNPTSLTAGNLETRKTNHLLHQQGDPSDSGHKGSGASTVGPCHTIAEAAIEYQVAAGRM